MKSSQNAAIRQYHPDTGDFPLPPLQIKTSIDSVKLYLPFSLTRQEEHQLRENTGSIYVELPCVWNCHYRSFAFHQPTNKGIRLLDHLMLRRNRTKKPYFFRADIAMDLYVNDLSHGDQVLEFISAHHVQKWHSRKQRVIDKEGTRYTAQGSRHQQLVTYMKFGKITTKVRNEWRISGTRRMKANRLLKPSDLLELDLLEFMKDKFFLQKLNLDKLPKATKRIRRIGGLQAIKDHLETRRRLTTTLQMQDWLSGVMLL